MDFPLEKQPLPNKDKFEQEKLKLGRACAEELYEEMQVFLRAVLLFKHAQAQDPFNEPLTLVTILDDVSYNLSEGNIQSYRVAAQKIAAKHSELFTIHTIKLSNFFHALIDGDPLLTNIINDGVILVDTGIARTAQHLLKTKLIHPTKQGVLTYQERANQTLRTAHNHINLAVLDLYTSVINLSHTVLMSEGISTPNPEEVAGCLEPLVKEGKLTPDDVLLVKELYNLSRHILHGEPKQIKGTEYDQYKHRAQEYYERVKVINAQADQ